MNQQEPAESQAQTAEERREAEQLAIAERRARNAQAARREFESPTRNIFPGRSTYLTVWGALFVLVMVFNFLDLFYPIAVAGSLGILWAIWGIIGWAIRRSRNQETLD